MSNETSQPIIVASTDEQIVLLDELRLLIQETAQFHNDSELKLVLQEASFNLGLLAKRLRFSKQRFVLAVIGLSNVGKSTLLNALLGEDVAPRKNGPWTAAPIEFERGDQWEVAVIGRTTYRQKRWQCGTPDQVRDRLDEVAAGSGGEISQHVRKIIVRAPIELLNDGLVLADTPGFGAAQPDAQISTHEQTLKDYLEREVSQLFWVVLAEQGIGKTEKEFYDRYLVNACLDILVNGAEDWDANDRARFEQRFLPSFKTPPPVHWVSGLRGLQARQAKDARAFEVSGVHHLEQTIRGLARLDSAGALQTEARDVAAYLRDFRDSRRRDLSVWWRPDSWQRWLARTPSCNGLKEILAAILQQQPK